MAGTLCSALVAGAGLPVSASPSPASSQADSAVSGSHIAHRLASGALGNLLTYDYDNNRSGDDPAGPQITSLSATPAWDDHLDGADFGQPLVDNGTVYVATENDTIYAITAATGAVSWSLHVGTPPSLSVVDSAPTLSRGCGDINPLGITGTPVIDPAQNELFAVEETETAGANDWEHIQHWLVAVSLATHQELWHRQIDPPNPNTAGSYYIAAEQQRPALTLFNGRLYVPFGGLVGDCGQYHGYVTSMAETGSGAVGSYQVPTQREGAIWGAGGTMVSSQGDLYVATGNGSSLNAANFDEGNSVIELSSALQQLGVWAPSNWVVLNENDADIGSASVVQVPGTSLLFAAGKANGKSSFGFLMSEGHLGGVGQGAYTNALCSGGGVFGADATDTLGSGSGARIFIYAPCSNGTRGVQVIPSPASFHVVWAPSTGAPNGPPIVAGGVVWALDWHKNVLYGMSPATGKVVGSRSTDGLNHFATPGAGDGLLLVPTQGGVEAFSAT
jgi:outer membrane protein assembly factor BamB